MVPAVIFQSTPLSRGETVQSHRVAVRRGISIHSPLTRGDALPFVFPQAPKISIHSPLTRGDALPFVFPQAPKISIHSPLTRGDEIKDRETHRQRYFNPLPSHEGRPDPGLHRGWTAYFNPLPSHEGRPPATGFSPCLGLHFNPLPSHEGRQHQPIPRTTLHNISIHSPLTRGDGLNIEVDFREEVISIHSPLTRGDGKNRQFPISPSQIHYAIFTITSSTDLKLS